MTFFRPCSVFRSFADADAGTSAGAETTRGGGVADATDAAKAPVTPGKQTRKKGRGKGQRGGRKAKPVSVVPVRGAAMLFPQQGNDYNICGGCTATSTSF